MPGAAISRINQQLIYNISFENWICIFKLNALRVVVISIGKKIIIVMSPEIMLRPDLLKSAAMFNQLGKYILNTAL